MTSTFKPGSVWELTANANCIPAGRYRLEEVHDEVLVFSVGAKISFGLAKDFYSSFLHPVVDRNKTRTSAVYFFDQYAELLQQPTINTPDIARMTFCAMDYRLQRKLQKLLSRAERWEEALPMQ